ncbi:unnamed protein product, partial [Nesidiocoris tenuis]
LTHAPPPPPPARPFPLHVPHGLSKLHNALIQIWLGSKQTHPLWQYSAGPSSGSSTLPTRNLTPGRSPHDLSPQFARYFPYPSTKCSPPPTPAPAPLVLLRSELIVSRRGPDFGPLCLKNCLTAVISCCWPLRPLTFLHVPAHPLIPPPQPTPSSHPLAPRLPFYLGTSY